jgi:RNA polymerase sigma-70 factor (ECF subfamily)
MDNYKDIELVQLSVGGDARAFERLVQRHYMSAYKVSYKWCGIKEDAEDIAQEVFVKVAQKLKTFGQRSSFKTWLYRITINTAKDFTRKYATKRLYETAFALEPGSNNPVPSRNENPDAAQLYKEITKLPEKQKMAVLLVYVEELSHKEASQVLKCPEATVSWRIFQAKKKLKKSLEYEI